MERFGITKCGWSEREVVLLDVAPPPLPGLFRPLFFRRESWGDPAVPPIWFSGTVWESDDAMRNLTIAAQVFTAALGAVPDGETLIFCEWTLCLVPRSHLQSVHLERWRALRAVLLRAAAMDE